MYKQKSLITGYPRVISEKLLFNEGHKVAFLSPNLNFLRFLSEINIKCTSFILVNLFSLVEAFIFAEWYL